MIIDDEPVPASALGILRCLRQLAEEAETLNLRKTSRAIESALETIARESDAARERHRPAMH